MSISNIPDNSQSIAMMANNSAAKPVQPTGNAVEPAVVQEPKAKEAASLSMAEMAEIVQKTVQALSSKASDLKFMIDQDNGQPVVQVIDRESQEIIRQIPSVEMLALAKKLEKMQGVFFSGQA